MEKDSYLLALSRYIHLNPYRAGVVKRPETYSWSSYPGYINKVKQKDWVNYSWILNRFHEDLNKARWRYQEFVLEGLKGEIKNPLSEIQKGFLLGSEQFITRIANLVKGKVHREIPDSRRFRGTVSVEKIIRLVSKHFQVKESTLTMRGIKKNLVRRIAIYLARQHTYENNSTIGRYFDIGYTGVSQVAGRLKREMKKKSKLRQTIQELENKLK